MKKILALTAVCVLVFSSAGYSAEIQKKAENKTMSLPGYETPKKPTDARARYTPPATGVLPPQETVTSAPPPEPEQIAPDRSSGDPKCPEGYFCKARVGGTSVYCQKGEGDKDCNAVAYACRNNLCTNTGSPLGLDCSKYCN